MLAERPGETDAGHRGAALPDIAQGAELGTAYLGHMVARIQIRRLRTRQLFVGVRHVSPDSVSPVSVILFRGT